LQPQNEHKQLIVIDFEYAGPNVRGYEFANHFIEWTYNYHDPQESHVCNASKYPTPEEQRRFIQAYVQHRPEYPHAGSTPNLKPVDTPSESGGDSGLLLPTPASTSSIADFMLDARAPPGGWREDEKRREEQVEKQVQELMDETRMWRIADSAFWIAWGIMQAKVPGLENDAPKGESEVVEETQPDATAPSEEEAGDSEFDYLGYAQERAMLFWGDCVQMGLVKLEQLPEELKAKIKMVEY
jgi:choline kinase